MSRERLQFSDQFCVCSLGEAMIAVPALSVREVTACPDVFSIPAAPPLLVGLCHLRNEFLPVLDLSLVLGLSHGSASANSSLVVMESAEGAWAFTINRAWAIETLETAHVRDAGPDDGFSSIVTGTATFRDHVVRVLDTQCLSRSTAALLRDEWSRGGIPAGHTSPQDAEVAQ